MILDTDGIAAEAGLKFTEITETLPAEDGHEEYMEGASYPTSI